MHTFSRNASIAAPSLYTGRQAATSVYGPERVSECPAARTTHKPVRAMPLRMKRAWHGYPGNRTYQLPSTILMVGRAGSSGCGGLFRQLHDESVAEAELSAGQHCAAKRVSQGSAGRRKHETYRRSTAAHRPEPLEMPMASDAWRSGNGVGGADGGRGEMANVAHSPPANVKPTALPQTLSPQWPL
jgi:hypothetical protein